MSDAWRRLVAATSGCRSGPSWGIPPCGGRRWAPCGRLARRGWWHRAPFLPVPGDAYWHFRLVTAYGGDGSEGDLTKEDVVAFLRWCQRTRPPGG